MEIRPVGGELFHTDRETDGQTYMTNLIVAFRNPASAPKIIGYVHYITLVSNPLPPVYMRTVALTVRYVDLLCCHLCSAAGSVCTVKRAAG